MIAADNREIRGVTVNQVFGQALSGLFFMSSCKLPRGVLQESLMAFGFRVLYTGPH
jgi:hypothetical protein